MNLLDSIESLRQAIFGARNQQSELQARLKELTDKRNQIANAPLCRADLEALILNRLEAQRDRGLADGELITGLAYSQTKLSAALLASPDGTGLAEASPFTAPFDNRLDSNTLDRLVSLLALPGEVLARLSPAIDRLDFSQAGLPLTERRVKVPKLDTEINKIQAELERIDAELQAAIPSPVSVAKEGPQLGEVRYFDGQRAVWTKLHWNSNPGWLYDPVP